MIFSCTLFGLLPCVACCIKIDFEEAVIGLIWFAICVASAFVIVIITMAFFALARDRVCRGFYLDEIADSGIENYEPIHGWSFDHIRYKDSGEIVPGFDKPKAVFILYIAYILLAWIVLSLCALALFCEKDMSFKEYWPVKAKKIQDPKAVAEYNKWLETKEMKTA